MPPKNKHTRDDVILAAVSVAEEFGLHALTARKVAQRLGSSTAPVYQQFATMDDLALAVIGEAKRSLLEFTRRPYTDRVFLNMGVGIAMFACEHSLLYRALMLEGSSYSDVVHEVVDTLDTEMTGDRRFVSLSDSERRELLMKMWTFTHGLASLICVGLVKECSQECITKTLMDVGTDVIGATLAKRQNRVKN